MKLTDAISNFLYDKDYFITLYEEKVHVYKYQELIKLSSDSIILKMNDFNIEINGKNLTIVQMDRDEILITGKILNIGKIYER